MIVIIGVLVIAIILWGIWYFYIFMKPQSQDEIDNISCWNSYDKIVHDNPGISPARCPGDHPSKLF